MKKLILLLITFTISAHANYIKKDDIGKCNGITVYLKSKKCGQDCIKLPKDYNCNYFELREFKEVEENSISCLTDCDDEFESLTCEDGFQKKKGMISVYCYREIAEKIIENDSKKENYIESMQLKEQKKTNRKEAIKDLKETAVLKNWNQLNPVERKAILGLEISDEELNLE